MIKNKYYIGQKVGVVGTPAKFTISSIRFNGPKCLLYSGLSVITFYEESELELLPEKQKIVLWQWLHKADGKWYQHIGSEHAYSESHHAIKVKIVEELEIP